MPTSLSNCDTAPSKTEILSGEMSSPIHRESGANRVEYQKSQRTRTLPRSELSIAALARRVGGSIAAPLGTASPLKCVVSVEGVAQMTQEHRAWGEANQRANIFLLDSASFYVSARRLLIPGTGTGLMPGLVCGAYALEHLLKAALGYENQKSWGHELVKLADQLPDPAIVDHDDLELFSAYFQSRYFENAPGILNSGDHLKLDRLYYSIYRSLKIPLPYHCRSGLLASVVGNDRPQVRAEREALERDNAHFGSYADLYRRSTEALEALH